MESMNTTDQATTPALAAPSGATSNLADPESILTWAVVTVAIAMSFTTLAVGLRVFTKIHVAKSMGWDDYTLIIAWTACAALAGVALTSDTRGHGSDQWDVTIQSFLETTQLGNIDSILYCVGLLFAKLSVLMLYMRVFAPIKWGGIYWTNLGLIWFNILFYAAAIIVLICQCVPREKIWNPSLPGHCIDIGVGYIVSVLVNVLSDFAILVFPIWAIWRLQIPLKQKLGVGVVFATGVFALTTSIMRFRYSVLLVNSPDKTFVTGQMSLFAIAEVSTVILCGCFPVFPRLARFTWGQRSTTTYQHPTSRRTSQFLCSQPPTEPSERLPSLPSAKELSVHLGEIPSSYKMPMRHNEVYIIPPHLSHTEPTANTIS